MDVVTEGDGKGAEADVLLLQDYCDGGRKVQ